MQKIITPSLLVLTAFVIGGIVFKVSTPRGCERPSENIFVLTGDGRRIPFAVKLIKDYPERRLYIIGAVAPNIINFPPDLMDRIYWESVSKNTYQNALAIKNIVMQKSLDNITVVTTEDHMNRSLRLIKSEIPNTNIVACSVPLNKMSAADRLSRWTMEYFKYIGTLFGFKARG